MARLPEVVFHYAQKDRRPKEKIQHIAKMAREAGHLSTTKRGRGASEMTEHDVVNLIFAANGCGVSHKDDVEAVPVFRALRPWGHWHDKERDTPLRYVAQGETFGQALEILIADSPRLRELLSSFVASKDPNLDADVHKSLLENCAEVGIEVSIERYAGAIKLWHAKPGHLQIGESSREVEDELHFSLSNSDFSIEQISALTAPYRHRKNRATIDFWTFYAMHVALLPNKRSLEDDEAESSIAEKENS